MELKDTTSSEEGLSLGWNCNSAVVGVSTNLRRTRQNGYKTCPFDEMMSNYEGIVKCFQDDFKYFCDPEYLKVIKIPPESLLLNTHGDGDMIIYNTKYNFLFNHESHHANLHVIENWENGMDHYIMNNYEEFIIRYKRRIQNMRDLLQSGKFINFILTRPETDLDGIPELLQVIKNKFPLLNFKFHFLDCDKNIYRGHLLLMKIDKEDEEIKRLET